MICLYIHDSHLYIRALSTVAFANRLLCQSLGSVSLSATMCECLHKYAIMQIQSVRPNAMLAVQWFSNPFLSTNYTKKYSIMIILHIDLWLVYYITNWSCFATKYYDNSLSGIAEEYQFKIQRPLMDNSFYQNETIRTELFQYIVLLREHCSLVIFCQASA